ncbi:MAG: hypothetical protein CBB97_13340 [Candidatus Endolissoclinum sp. TMED37]|nr:MAG: hypothetical protein CBB97_13340 [Candidatus Endolissoclinum sp. TMED37]|tara:strand:+ start:224 stop:460 length:237 start_codon:yes stop_codon:yes gene_type:complete
MAQYGKTTIEINAPLIIAQDGIAVWMEEEWPRKFFGWLEEQNINLRGIKHGNGHLVLEFKTPEDLTLFGFKYDEKKIF